MLALNCADLDASWPDLLAFGFWLLGDLFGYCYLCVVLLLFVVGLLICFWFRVVICINSVGALGMTLLVLLFWWLDNLVVLLFVFVGCW